MIDRTDNPKLSIAIPVRNGANFLDQCMESLAGQDLTGCEIVVSDNCSKDTTGQILERWKSRLPCLRVLRMGEFVSVWDNLNFLTEHCGGRWVRYLCHDDLLLPRGLEHTLAAIEEAERLGADLIGNDEVHQFGTYRVESRVPASAPTELHSSPGPDYVKRFLAGNAPFPALTTACVRRTAWEKAGKFQPYFTLDNFLWAEVLLDHGIVWIGNAITVNRIHGRQVATYARKANKMSREQRQFWPLYLRSLKKRTHVSRKLEIKARLRWVAVCATDTAIALLTHRFGQAAAIMLAERPWWWPVILPAVARAYVKEQRRTAALRTHLAVTDIYPG